MNPGNDVRLERITTSIGAVVHGVDLRETLSSDTISAIRSALVAHGVIFFRNQQLTREQYWLFASLFGPTQTEESMGSSRDQATDLPTMDMYPTRQSTATWHADTTSLAHPPFATLIRAVEIPAFGGDTCWSSMYAAWDALSPAMQGMLDGLTAVHDIGLSAERLAETAAWFEEAYAERHARRRTHPVVMVHPETGRKALYINEAYVTRIVELDRLESAAVLAFLFRHVERPDFVARWKWSVDDLAFWDNRAVQHYAVPDYTAKRRMQRIVLAGDEMSGMVDPAPQSGNAGALQSA